MHGAVHLLRSREVAGRVDARRRARGAV